ncbi:MAG: oligosaccharide flippase family protein [Pseudomonadota bacterium]
MSRSDSNLFVFTFYAIADRLGVFAKLGSIAVVDQMVVSGTRFLATLLVARFCSPDELGLYSLGFSIVAMVAVVQESLVSTPYSVLCNVRKGLGKRSYSGAVLIHHVFFAGISLSLLLIVCTGLSYFYPNTELLPVLWVLVITVPLSLMWEFVRRLQFAHVTMFWALIIDSALAAILISGLLILAASDALTAKSAYWVVAIACAVVGLTWLLSNRRVFVLKRRSIIFIASKHWKFGRWLLGSQLVMAIYQWSSYWLFAIFLSTTQTGIFSACMNVVMLANPLTIGMANILDPRLSQAFKNGGRSEIFRVLKKVILIMGGVIFLYFIFLSLFGDFVIRVLYNNDAYLGNQHLISVLAFMVVLGAIGTPLTLAFRALQKTDLLFKIQLVEVVLMILIFVPAIQYFGMLGGAYAMLAGFVIGSVMRIIAIREILNNPEDAAKALR